MKPPTILAVECIVVALCVPSARADMNQFWLAAQHDWGGKKGFFLTLSAEFLTGESASLQSAKLILGVADGKEWTFLEGPNKWEFGKQYVAKAVINADSAEIWLDGKRVAQRQVRFVPAAHPLAFNEQPSFLRGAADYQVRQTRLNAAAEGNAISLTFQRSQLPVQLLLLNPAAGSERRALDVRDHVEIEADFTFERAPDLKALSPFIDRYGQAIHADWPDKVRSDSRLTDFIAEEQRRLAEWGQPTDRDAFGGLRDAGWSERPTGYFRTIKRNGMWWLITPEGNPCFYIGLCDIPALDWEATPVDGREFLFEWLPERTGEFARAWRINPWNNPQEKERSYLVPHAVNLIRKYGKDWDHRAVESTIQRTKALGFCGFGKWTHGGTKGVCDVVVLYHGEIPNLARHPDIFDPQIRQRWTDLLRRQIEPRKSDPYLIGWSVGNEFDENIAAADVVRILGMAPDVPGRRALIEHALTEHYGGDRAKLKNAWRLTSDDIHDHRPQPPPQDIEALRRFYADRYYRFIYETVKSIDPNHLYLGMWITPNWWENEADWDLIAPHCDVIGYDFYAREFTDSPIGKLLDKHDKPALCGEFSFAPDYNGARGYGRYHNQSSTEAEAGARYTRWVESASQHPKCVGLFYFQYRDQPITGRGPVNGPPALVHGENFAFGIVDVTDRLKWKFVEQVRSANLQAPRRRLNLTQREPR